MLVRPFTVPEFAPDRDPQCTYLVSYEGEADDLNAWHAHYLESHTRHVAMLPGLRELEVYTRVDWVSGQPWSRLNYMQRNNVAFDDAEAFEAALRSPVRQAIRADFKRLSGVYRPQSASRDDDTLRQALTGARRLYGDDTGWLGRLDSNQGMAESKSAALPLGYAPI